MFFWMFQTFYNEKPNVCIKGLRSKEDNKAILMASLVITFVKRCEETYNLFPSALYYSTSTTMTCCLFTLFISVEVHFPW